MAQRTVRNGARIEGKHIAFAVALSSSCLMRISDVGAEDAKTDVVSGVHIGQLVTVRESVRNKLPDAGENYLVSYVAPTPTGGTTIVYGQISLPASPPPEGGYPVISWGNGTTGNAPQCAPSLISSYAVDYLNEWVKRGYAVVRTDYVGWGADGPRLELNGKSNADSMAHLVAAAHEVSDQLSDDWIAIGHSLGGGAALWAASQQYNYNLKGAIALAPVGPGVLAFIEGLKQGVPIGHFTQQFVSVTFLGAQATDPTIDLNRLVADEMKPQVDAMRDSACLGDPVFMSFPHLQPGQYLNPGEDYDKLVDFLMAQDPSSLKLAVPVLIAQGTKDQTTVTPETTEKMVSSLCASGATVDYQVYEGADHRDVIAQSSVDAFRFAETVLSGEAPESTCQD